MENVPITDICPAYSKKHGANVKIHFKRLKTLKVKTSYLEYATLDLALFITFHYYTMSCILSAKMCSVRMAPNKTLSRGYVSLSRAKWL